MIENIRNLISGRNPFIKLERRILILFLLTAFFLGIMGNIINLLIGAPITLMLIGFVVPLIIFLIIRQLIRSGVKGDYSPLLIVVLLLFFPVQYIFNAGRESNTVTLIFTALLMTFFVFPGKRAGFFFIALVAEYIILGVLEQMFPDMVVKYTSDFQRFADTLSGNLLYFVVLFMALTVIKNVYNFQIKRGELQNRLLRDLNSQLASNSEIIRKINKQLDESEKQVRHILDSIPALVLVIQEEKVVFVNRWSKLSLHLDFNKMENEGIYHHICHDSREIFQQNIRQGSSGNNVLPYEIKLIDSGGNERTMLVHTSDITFNADAALLIVLSDVTELKEKEETLKIYSEQLKKEDAAKARFISMLSHDLRSPFQGLLGIGSILKDDFDSIEPQKMKNLIVLLNDSLNSQYKLLDDILNWTRFQNDKTEPVLENIFLCDAVDSVFTLFELTAKTKVVSFINMIPGYVVIKSDKKMLDLLLRNLISNAIKFSKAGDGVIADYEDAGDQHVIKITDTGTGIVPALLEKLSAGEWGLSKTGTAGEKGSGLGLSMVREILSRLGGTLEIQSVVTKGVTILCRFPK